MDVTSENVVTRERPEQDAADAILAVFDSPDRARRAVRRLSQIASDPSSIVAVPLAPGRYPLATINPAQEARAAVRGAALGAPLGAMLGLGLSLALLGATPFAAIGATAAGALAGFLSGGLGAISRTRWTDSGKAVLEVKPGREYVLVTIPARAAADPRVRSSAIRSLLRTGAIAFLDPNPPPTVGRN